ILVAGPSVGTGVPSNYTAAPFFTGFAGVTAEIAEAVPVGQCTFQYVSATSVKLLPKNGNSLKIGGALYGIPAAGISAGNAGVLVNGSSGSLAASTRYLVSAYNNGGTMALAFWAASTYSHMADTTAGNIGTEVISLSGVPTTAHTLIGMV